MMQITDEMVSKFWCRVQKADGCWIWTGAKSGKYGGLSLGRRKSVRAHRLSYCMHYDCDPGPLLVCHHCDNPICVRPDHLFLGTPKDNTSDANAKGRLIFPINRSRGSQQGSAKLTEVQVAEIRRRRKENEHALAAEFGVSRWTINRIRFMKNYWAHVQ